MLAALALATVLYGNYGGPIIDNGVGVPVVCGENTVPVQTDTAIVCVSPNSVVATNYGYPYGGSLLGLRLGLGGLRSGFGHGFGHGFGFHHHVPVVTP